MAKQALSWTPDSFYRLRDRNLAGHVIEIGQGGLRGEVVRYSSLRRYNGQLHYEPDAVQGSADWDLNGNCREKSSWDLMELIRP
jgi:hypothetical protein